MKKLIGGVCVAMVVYLSFIQTSLADSCITFVQACIDRSSSGSINCGSGGENGCAGYCSWVVTTYSCGSWWPVPCGIPPGSCASGGCHGSIYTYTGVCSDDGMDGCECDSI